MAKEYIFNWQIPVPEALLKGTYHDRWEEETGLCENGFFRVDEFGFYLHWLVEGKEAQVLDLCLISEARPGGISKDSKVALMQELEGKGPIDDRCFCITYGVDFVNSSYLRLIAETPESARRWIDGLTTLTHNFRAAHVCPTTTLMKHWKMLCLGVNERRKIPVRSITRTFASGKAEKNITQCLVDLGLCVGKNEEIEVSDFTFDQFYELCQKICPRTDVFELFNNLTNGKEYLTVEPLINFLNERQRDPRLNEILFPFYDRTRAVQLITKYEKNTEFVAKERFSVDGFLRFLMSDDNAPVHLDRIELYQDMEQPLAHYYVNSSHNTYLVGRQFGGRSSVEMYRQVLLAGCRCIEIDCWDGTGEDKGEPIVTHGKAMCTDVPFRDVIVAIRDTAFIVSEYPVILSFENHCSKSNQLKMAKYCLDILGDLLLSKALDNYPLEASVPLPPPSQLKRKILIKNKRLKTEVEKAQLEQFLREGKLDEQEEEAENPADLVVGEEAPQGAIPVVGMNEEAHPELKSKAELVAQDAITLKNKIRSLAKMTKEPALSKEEEDRLLESYKYTGATTTIHPLLSSMVNYTHPVKFAGFDVSEQTNCYFHMSSFSESTGLGYLKQSALEFVNYNKRQISRIYPKGGRVDSSNFLPQIFWNAGCQMVALNFQTPDLAMQLNQGKFEYNGSCGYLLKPDFMRRPDRMFDPFSESPVDGVIAAYCSVQVISGQFLSDRKVGTYVEVEMYGLPTDTIKKEFRTRTVPQNGLNPVYSEEPFVFRKVVLPDLAVLRFAVYDESGKLLGQRILPLDGLQSGYRHLSLRTESNIPITLPTLFCYIVLRTYVPEGLGALVDALSDPKGYLSMMEKRQRQMEAMGIKQEDIADVPLKNKGQTPKTPTTNRVGSSPQTGSGLSHVPSSNQLLGPQTSANAKETKPVFEPIKTDDLRKDKGFQKLKKRHTKETEEFVKRHLKERITVSKIQSAVVDRLVVGCDRQKLPKGKQVAISDVDSKGNLSNDAMQMISKALENEAVKSTVIQQTEEWSAMVRGQMEAEYNLSVQQCKEEFSLLKLLLESAHQAQLSSLKQKQDAEGRELRQQQTKKSMEDSRQINNDKSIKTKTERDRRIKELQEKNLKIFLEARKRLAMKHEKQLEQLRKVQADKRESFEKEAKRELELTDQMYQEKVLAAKPETAI